MNPHDADPPLPSLTPPDKARSDGWLPPPLAQALRRLGLLVDERTFPELDDVGMTEADQRSLTDLRTSGSAFQQLLAQRRPRPAATTTELLVLLEHLRVAPGAASDLLGSFPQNAYPDLLAGHALRTARALYDAGRSGYLATDLDAALHYMLGAQREFLFALSTGRIPNQTMEVLGKYAVAVAFTSRWYRTNAATLQFALRCHRRSIAQGNTSPEAYAYLKELKTELFNVTRDRAYLDRALDITQSHDLPLARAELLLKRGILALTVNSRATPTDLRVAYEIADAFTPVTGVEYVTRAIVKQLAFVAIGHTTPLSADQIRLPFGFLVDLPTLAPTRFASLRQVIIDSLEPMRAELAARGSRPNFVAQQLLFAVLRESVSRGTSTASEDANLAVAVSHETRAYISSRYIDFQYCDALLARAEVRRDDASLEAARTAARDLAGRYPLWPLPKFVLARALSLDARPPTARVLESKAAWHDLTTSVMRAPDYRRSDLGGRSSVFAVEDARGDLATTLVFKPATLLENAEREAANMRVLSAAVDEAGESERFGVPRSLAVVQLPDGAGVHVIERRAGRLLSHFDGHAAFPHLEAAVEFLAIFHRTMGTPEVAEKGWRRLREGIKLWTRSLLRDAPSSRALVGTFGGLMPAGLPLVAKRDAHADNWVVEASGRLVAVDLETGAFLPLGHDLAQLIEDFALVPVSQTGFHRRRQLIRRYLRVLGDDLDPDAVYAAYGWFALVRAVFVASLPSASKARHAHARQLARFLASSPEFPAYQELAATVVGVLQRHAEGGNVGAVDHDQLRRSKRLARVLRHRARDLGLSVDDGGFVELDELAEAVGMSVKDVLAVISHPAEPRFEVADGRARALYGHSFPVKDLPNLEVEPPEVLYHGTSWKVLSNIVSEGLQPMGRQKVHLTINASEALEVARRHGLPALVAVSTPRLQGLRAVADAVWAADSVSRDLLEVRNAFSEIPTPPTWLTASLLADEGSSG